MSLVRLEGVHFDPEGRHQVARDAAGRIATLQQELRAACEISIETGDVPATVANMAQQMNASLLVIGRGRRAGFLGRLRTNAYAILRESPCPVATV
jgi:nucleotide-binding universal stress UspA family protein